MELRLGKKTDFIDDAAALGERVPGALIRAVRRHGKFLVLDLEIGAAAGGFFTEIHGAGPRERLTIGAHTIPWSVSKVKPNQR